MTSKTWHRYNVSILSENRRRKHDVVTTLHFCRSNGVGKTTLWQRCFDIVWRRSQKTTKNQRCHNVVCKLECHLYYNTKLSLQLYLLQDEASPLIKEGRSKRMDIQGKTPAKNLIIQFHLHLSINNQWLADFKILYISSPFTTNTFHEVYFIETDHNKLFYSLKRQIHLSNVFFPFDVSFFDQNTTLFASSVIAMFQTTNLFFVFKKLLSLPLLSRVRLWLANLIDWLIWLVHQFRLVH